MRRIVYCDLFAVDTRPHRVGATINLEIVIVAAVVRLRWVWNSGQRIIDPITSLFGSRVNRTTARQDRRREKPSVKWRSNRRPERFWRCGNRLDPSGAGPTGISLSDRRS